MKNLVSVFVIVALLLCGARSALAVEIAVVDVTEISPYIHIEVVGSRNFDREKVVDVDFDLFTASGMLEGNSDQYRALRDTTLEFSRPVRMEVMRETGRNGGDIAAALIFGVCAKKTRVCETIITDRIDLTPGMTIVITGVVIEPKAKVTEPKLQVPTVDQLFHFVETPKTLTGIYIWAHWQGGINPDHSAWISPSSSFQADWVYDDTSPVTFTLQWEDYGEESESNESIMQGDREVTSGSRGADSPRTTIRQILELKILPSGTIKTRLGEEGIDITLNGSIHITADDQWGTPLFPEAYVPFLSLENIANPQTVKAYAYFNGEANRWEWWPLPLEK